MLVASRTLLVVAITLICGIARADQPRPPSRVVLTPLDAETRLEIYGQAVATEIARALVAGGIEVTVLGAKMGTPPGTRLVIGGALTVKANAVSLAIHVRNPVDNTTLDSLSATAPNLLQIDKAAADLSGRVLPVIRERLAALDRANPDHGNVTQVRNPPVREPKIVAKTPMLVGIRWSSPTAEPFRVALSDAVDRWSSVAHREPRMVDASALGAKLAPQTLTTAKVSHAVAFEILDFTVKTKKNVPLAKARVRVRISDTASVKFDRIIITDTIVGDHQMAPAALAARVADEVLAILRPHMKRVTPWP